MNINNRNLLIIISLVYSLTSNVLGQEVNALNEGLNKNAIYGSVGFVAFGTATVYYERRFNSNGRLSSFIKIGAGAYALPGSGSGGQYILAQYGLLTGSKKHHLEMGIGPNLFLNGEWRDNAPFTATIGWRIQRPFDNYIFRIGASWPEGIYIGIGFSF